MARKTRKQKKSQIPNSSNTVKIESTDSGNDEVECKNCNVIFSNIEEKEIHELECSANTSNIDAVSKEKTKFLCTVCHQYFKYESGLNKHKLRHKPPGGFICAECKLRFVTDAERTLHKEVVHKIFKCLICNEKCSSEESFLNHINTLHAGRDREYVICDDCGAQFRQKNQLKLHRESKCGTIRCYTCNECNSKFMTQNTLNAHMLIHSGEKKHLCNFCGNSFLSRGQLKIHERSHTKEKPYKCLVCNKAFAHRESLVTHSSLHTGVKPYQCQCCGNQFSCIGNLIKHRRIRPQTCGLPKYANVKCAPRASTKVPGSLTLKKERVGKRSYAKRKIITVPELLTERAELTSQSDEHQSQYDVEMKVECENLKNECTILENQKVIQSENYTSMKADLNEIESQTECIELLDEKQSSTISYNMPKSSVLVLTPDGNYVIASLENEVKRETEIRIPPPQLEQIIILNSGDLEFTEMEVEQTIEDKGHLNIVETTSTTTNPLAIDDQIDEVIQTQQYVENSLHLEIVPVDDTIDVELSEQPNQSNQTTTIVFECDICAKGFKQEKSLIKHMSTKHNIECDFIGQQFKCQYCDKQYSKENLLLKHVQCHGENGELRYKCSCCPKYFDTKENMQEHAQKVHEDKLKCKFCQKIYKEVDCKMAHIRKVHMKTGAAQKKYTFVCVKCGKKFNSRVTLSDHEQADCGRSPIYKCQYENCGKSLHSLGSLKIHHLIHTGDLPFECSFCKKKFRTHGQVKVHERSHSGEKPFKCNECPKAFAHRESLLTHLSLHTGLKRFGCQGCGGRFSCISNLQAHRRTHQNTCGQLPLDTKAQYSFNLDDGTIVAPDINSTNKTN